MFHPDVTRMTSWGRHQHRVDTTVDGFPTATWQDAVIPIVYFSAKPFHGSQLFRADRPQARDGMTLTTWFDSTFKATDRILVNDDAAQAYELTAPPEDVNLAHRFMILTVERLVDD